MDNIIEISPFIRAAASPTDLLKPKGKIGMNPLKVGLNIFDKTGKFFAIQTSGFDFKLFVCAEGVIAERNGEVCALTPEMFPNGKLEIFLFMWSPTKLSFLSGYSVGEDIVEVRPITETAPVSVPLEFKKWLKAKTLERKSIYQSMDDFRDAVFQCFVDLRDKIEDTGSGDTFWDYTYKGNKLVDKKPKKETNVQLLFKPLLDTELFLRGIEIFRENTTLSGDIDFTVTGAVEQVGSVNMCIELKNAHSKELENGLSKQLPDYMRSQSSQYGIYCVLNYNVDNGDRTDRAILWNRLNLIQINSDDPLVKSKIRVILIDLDKNIVLGKRN